MSSPSRWQTFWQNLQRRLGGRTGAAPGGTVDHWGADGAGAATTPAEAPARRRLRVGVVSTVGNYREHNEDNFYLPTRPDLALGSDLNHRDYAIDLGDDDAALRLFVVADGMGGQLAGEKASQMAVDIIPKELARRLNGTAASTEKGVQRAVRDAVAAANQEILGLSVVQTEFNNMGTTVVLALIVGGRLYVAGIGDSRVYRIRDGQIEQLTEDHSLAWALFKAGTITAEELPHHKFNHILYLYLGSRDARSGPDEVITADLVPGDRFLLASDGLTGVVGDAQIAAIVAASDHPVGTARTLIQLALDNQSKDNITSLVIHVD